MSSGQFFTLNLGKVRIVSTGTEIFASIDSVLRWCNWKCQYTLCLVTLIFLEHINS